MTTPSRPLLFIPFDKELYDDLVRFSDGEIDVPSLAAEQILDYFERNLGAAASGYFGARAIDFYQKYFPSYAEEVKHRLAEAEELDLMELIERPMVWKEVTVPAGTKVRMQYGGTHHFAVVRDGHIEYQDRRYSPSQWAKKIAQNTSRNAWRDIELKEANSLAWIPAQTLRDQARTKLRRE